MTYQKYIRIIILLLIPLAVLCFLAGTFSTTPGEIQTFTSVRGEVIELYGKGLYRYDSKSMVAQGIAQDFVTILIALPMLLRSFRKRDSVRGKLFIIGVFGYLLYTYISYVFLWSYNPLFIIYTLLLSLSLGGFILSLLSVSPKEVAQAAGPGLPRRFLGSLQIIIGTLLLLMWLARIYPTWFGAVPFGLEHYTTLVIQGLDLGIIVPLSIVSGILMLKKNPAAPLLSSIVLIKGMTLGLAIGAMMVAQLIEGIAMNPIEAAIFIGIIGFLIYSVILLMRSFHPINSRSATPGISTSQE